MDLETFKNELKKKKPNATILHLTDKHVTINISEKDDFGRIIKNDQNIYKTYIEEKLFNDTLLEGYLGYLSQESNTIEIGLNIPEKELDYFFDMVRDSSDKNNLSSTKKKPVEINLADGSIAIIGEPSDKFRIHLTTFEEGVNSYRKSDSGYSLTYKSKLVKVNDDNLEKVFDVLNSILLTFYWRSEKWVDFMRITVENPNTVVIPSLRNYEGELNTSRAVYNRQTTAMYMNSMALKGLPNFRFLALYQILEYDFQVFHKKVTIKKIKSFIKDPTISLDNAAGYIIQHFKDSSGDKHSESESAMLKSVLKECLGKDGLKSILSRMGKLKTFYNPRSKEDQLVVSEMLAYAKKNNTPEGDIEDNFLDELSNRIYNIRCKIVHSKKEWGVDDFILPHSEAYNKLDNDIIMLDHIVRKVLIYHAEEIG